ncbi:MAG: FixH family protein [Geminicoccaceae bacterium]
MRKATRDNARPRSWIPYYFVGFFGVMLIANGTMVYFATTTFGGLWTDRPYERGIRYNETLEQMAAQEALGWESTISLEQRADLSGDLEVQLIDADGQGINRADMRAKVVRPLEKGHEQVLVLTNVGDGRYTAPVQLAMPGQWEVRVHARVEETDFRVTERVILR